MDYKKRYKEALTRAKEFQKSKDGLCVLTAESIFPELRESKDEKIRVRDFMMKQFFRPISPDLADTLADEIIKVEKTALNEKQKESEDERIRKEISTLYADIDSCISELLAARTNKDAEAEGKALFRMEGLMVATLQDLSCVEDWLEKQKEQKPVEKQDYSGLSDLERVIHRGFLCAGVENVPVTIIKETAQECVAQMKPAEWDDYTKTNLDRALQIIKDAKGKLQGYQSDDGIYECDKAIECLEHFLYRGLEIEKPAEWSEEDERMLESIIWHIRNSVNLGDIEHTAGQLENWLKSLSLNRKKMNEDVVKPCSNEWSEEDEHRRKDAIYFLESAKKHYADTSEIEKTIAWLKSLRPQPHWKPTKNMLEALKWAKCEFHPDCPETMEQLQYLYTELKKIYYDGD